MFIKKSCDKAASKKESQSASLCPSARVNVNLTTQIINRQPKAEYLPNTHTKPQTNNKAN
jgi:hypothetical protein